MLKINAIKIDIQTTDKQYGAYYTFSNGLNIIKGNNSTGKSSLFQAILYALGFEELLGGKNEKTMQSVLRDAVEYPQTELHNIIQSYIYLEIENKTAVTIKRAVKSPTASPELIEVFFGNFLTKNDNTTKRQSMYVHYPGGASDKNHGFHSFLSVFLNWEMPEVINSQGASVQLYIQQVASSFIIEQKAGWSDFMATIPYFGIKHAGNRVIEFILNMDVFENQKKKQQLIYELDSLKDKWKSIFFQMNNIARDCRLDLNGIKETPEILKKNEVYLSKQSQTGTISVEQEIKNLTLKYEELNSEPIKTVGESASIFEQQLLELQDFLNTKQIQYELLNSELSLKQQQYKQYEEQYQDVIDDLYKNKNAQKVIKLGGTLNSNIANGICPTCHQHIPNSLLPNDIEEEVLGIEENIKYIESKKNMIQLYLDGQKKEMSICEQKISKIRNELSEIRSQIRQIKQDLLEDNRNPSAVEIERRINLRKIIELYNKKNEEFEELKLIIFDLSEKYKNILSEKNKLQNDGHSTNDIEKIKKLENNFVDLLKKFNYESKPLDAIHISNENYLPLTKFRTGETYSIRVDSSASDFIRCLWAYYISLMKVSIENKGNHPNLLMFDEPKQQDASGINFHSFLKCLSDFQNEQVIVFASFENKEESFIAATEGIKYNLIQIEDKLIKPIEEN